MSGAPREYLSIALFATSFGFGPVSKAVAVANQIRRVEPGAYLAYFGSGSDFEFAKTADVFNKVVAIDVDRPANLPALVHLLSGFDAAVSVMNKALPPHWPVWHRGLVMVDSLAWLLRSPPPGVDSAASYFVQDYMVPLERVEEWRDQVNLELVGPIIAEFGQFDRIVSARYFLLNFNGSASFIQPQKWFEHVIRTTTQLALESCELADRKIVIATNARIAERLAGAFGEHVLVANFPIRRMVTLMRDADVVLTTPGITSMLEAFHDGLELGLLLPLNYSQALLSQNYNRKLGGCSGLAPTSFGAEFEVAPGLPTHEGVRRTMTCVDNLMTERRAELQLRVDEMLDGRRLLRPADMETFRLEPSLTDGARKIASRVVALASANRPRGAMAKKRL